MSEKTGVKSKFFFVFLKCDPGEKQVRSGNSCKEFLALTQRWLQHVSIPLTGPNRLDVGRVDQSPEVVGVVATVQTQAQANTHHAHHRRNADRVGVAGVACFKFHTCFEFIGRGDSGLRGGAWNTAEIRNIFTQINNHQENEHRILTIQIELPV